MSVPVAPAQTTAPTITPTNPAPQGTAKERIDRVFSLGGKPPGHDRDADLYEAILALTPADFAQAAQDLPKRLSNYGKGEVGQNKARLFLEAFLDRWLTLDAPSALRYLTESDFWRKLTAHSQKDRLFDYPDPVVAAALRPLARHAPQWTHDWLAAQKPGAERSLPIETLLEEVARRDVAQARRFFATFADGPERVAALRGLVNGMAESDPRAGFELATSEPPSHLRDQLIAAVVRGAARKGRPLAAEILSRIGNPDARFEAAMAALEVLRVGTGDDLLPWIQEEVQQKKTFSAYWEHERWARTVAGKVEMSKLAHAADWAATLPNDPDRIFLRQFAQRWAKENPDAFRDWLTRHSSHLDAASASALRESLGSMEKSAPAIARWAEALPESPLRQQAMLDSALRSGRVEDAGAAYEALAATDKNGDLAAEIAGTLAQKNCEAAAAWVSSLGEGPAQTHSCRKLIERWVVRDATGGAAWLESLPAGKMRDAGLETYAQRVAMVDPAAAAEWAAQITDRQERGNAANSISLHWALEDPVAAREWLKAFPNIDDDQRRGILRQFR